MEGPEAESRSSRDPLSSGEIHPPKDPSPSGEIAAVGPEFICALGATAAQTLLNTTESISSMRGSFRSFNGIKLMPTFHPSFLLRDPSRKRDVWEDVQKIMKELFH